MNLQKIAKQVAEKNNLPQAYKYDFYSRDFDGMVELIGLVDDPNYNKRDFEGREMLFPKRWLTLGVFHPSYEVSLNG